MRVLAVTPQTPYDGVPHAGGAFLLKHLDRLATTHGAAVTVMTTEVVTDDVRDRVPGGIELIESPATVGRRTLAEGLRARVRWSPPPPGAIDALVATGITERARASDIIELHWTEMTPLVPILRRAGVRTPISVVEHDVGVESERHRIARYGSWRARIAERALGSVRDRRERRDLNLADVVFVFKSDDVDLLRRLGVTTPVHVIQPYLDAPPAADPSGRDPHEVLFTGALWRRENDEAARWLVEQVWPRVRMRVPDARLTLAGAGPSPALVAATRSSGVTLTGTVADLAPYYRRAAVFVAPLLIGGGLKFKVPQAMAYGLPVVATTIAAAGVAGEAPPDALWAVADAPEEMAEAIIAVIEDPARAAFVGAAAARWAAERYSFARSTAAIESTYRALVARKRDT